jgi:hypothetical protein
MYQPDAVRSLIRDSGDAIRNTLLRRGLPISFHAGIADRVSLAEPPLMTHSLKLAGVDLSPLGKAFHYRHGAQDSEGLPEALDGWIDAVANRRGTPANAAQAALDKVAGYHMTLGVRTHEVAPLIYAMFLPRFEDFRVVVGNHSIDSFVGGVNMRLTSRRLQAFRRTRLIRHRVNPFDLLTSPFGVKRACGSHLGTVYQRLLQLLPEFRIGLTAIVSAALHGGMSSVFASAFDTTVEREPVQADLSPFDIAISLVEHSPTMPYYDLRDAVADLIGGQRFIQLFEVPARWAGRTYTHYKREQHKAALLALRGDISHSARTTPAEVRERNEAAHLLQLSTLIR